jgi:sec-independent protein translocase protein TatB
MFDIGWSELLVIVVVAIIVVGPKELPRLLRTFGHYAGKLRRAAADFQRQFEDAMRESELDEVRKNLENIRSHTTGSVASDKPVMLPKPEGSPAPESVSVAPPTVDAPPKKPRAKRAPAKATPAKPAGTKAASAKRRKNPAEPGA